MSLSILASNFLLLGKSNHRLFPLHCTKQSNSYQTSPKNVSGRHDYELSLKIISQLAYKLSFKKTCLEDFSFCWIVSTNFLACFCFHKIPFKFSFSEVITNGPSMVCKFATCSCEKKIRIFVNIVYKYDFTLIQKTFDPNLKSSSLKLFRKRHYRYCTNIQHQ